MGIVMAVVMLLGTIALINARWKNHFVSAVILGGGLWNAFWYGLRHLGSFWGNTSIITGLLMVIAAAYLFGIIKLPKVATRIGAICLGASFLLYSVTIIQLNLGYPIIN